MEITVQVPSVFLGTAHPEADNGAPQVLAPPPTTAVGIVSEPCRVRAGPGPSAHDGHDQLAPWGVANRGRPEASGDLPQRRSTRKAAPAPTTTVTTMVPQCHLRQASPVHVVVYIAPASAVSHAAHAQVDPCRRARPSNPT